MTIFRTLLVLILTAGVSTQTFAGVLKRSELSAVEAAEVENFVNTEVRADLAANLETRIAEVSTDIGSKLLMGEPLSAKTRTVLADGVYAILFGQLARQGVYLNRKDFNERIGKALDFVSKLGFFPRAFTVGYMGRLQHGIGGSAGTQFNFYLDQGKIKMSSYTTLGVQAGYQAGKASTMKKIELYAAFCFGSCVGGDAVGYYLGMDGYASVGAGGGAFIEAGLDITDWVKYRQAKKSYSIKDLYQAKAIYVGFGYDIGFGAGISANAFYYSQDFEKTLGDLNDPYLSLKVAKQKLH